jgi:acetate kinase
MGLTPLEGLPMGTRSGSVDPGLLLHMLRDGGMTVNELDDLLNKRSGLLGLSEISNDMRTLTEAAADGSEAAALAIDVFCYQTARSIASYWSVGSKPQAIVLTGGIGEHASGIRARIVAELAAFDINLDEAANERAIPTDGVLPIGRKGAVAVLAIRTNEELMIARDTQRLIK